MAGPEDKRPPGQEDEDLFEDLDEFFAPLEETEWPGEGTTPPEPESPSGSSAEGPAEEWDLEIDLPDEAELLAEEAESPAGAEPSAAPGGEPEPQPTVTVDDEARGGRSRRARGGGRLGRDARRGRGLDRRTRR
jgi:hypothetical protein